MPLNGHTHLVSQGWLGNGTGLRNGSISKPLIIAQKKSLSGLGKDRDEAFPFWDHVFNAAAGAIQIKISASDDEDSDADTPNQAQTVSLKRTSTGIISNRRPVSSSCTSPGDVTPTLVDKESDNLAKTLNVMTLAKREAAKKGLYSRFFRGPILGPDVDDTPITEYQHVKSTTTAERPKKIRNLHSGDREQRREGEKSEKRMEKKKRKKEAKNDSEDNMDEKERKKRKEGKRKQALPTDGASNWNEPSQDQDTIGRAPASTDANPDSQHVSEKKRRKKNKKSEECDTVAVPVVSVNGAEPATSNIRSFLEEDEPMETPTGEISSEEANTESRKKKRRIGEEEEEDQERRQKRRKERKRRPVEDAAAVS